MKPKAAVASVAVIAVFMAMPARGQFRADTILSLLRINNLVFASTRTGLFQSSPSQQKWSAVKLPKSIAPGGCLNASDPGVTRIYYSPPVSALTERSDRCGIGLGLWMSADLGKSWKNVDGKYLFKNLLARSDGTLYAPARVPSDKSNVVAELEIYGGRPLVSADGGKTWVDTTGTESLPAVTNFFTCKKNPEHVCAGGMGARGYNMEYAPEKKKWTVKPWIVGEDDPEDTTGEEFLAAGGMGSGTSPCCYMQRATLENYYALGFGDVLQRVGVTLQAEKKQYEFTGGTGAKVVNVSMNLLPGVTGTSAIALLDLDETEVCWGLRYVDPDGGKHAVTPVITRLHNPALGRAHVVQVGQPYRRPIDLQGLEEFRKPGVYRMVLIFANGNMKKKDENEWTGTIVGTAVFEVEIKEK